MEVKGLQQSALMPEIRKDTPAVNIITDTNTLWDELLKCFQFKTIPASDTNTNSAIS
jgi:hypothetical protein